MMRVAPYSPEHDEAWDRLVEQAPMGTFLHTRRFLSYHGDRFADRSLMLYDERDVLAGVLPAAVDPDDASWVVSHPGITYGGLVHAGLLTGGPAIDALRAIRAHLAAGGYRGLRYKAVPVVYHRRPATDDRYALHAAGATLARCDLSCAVDLEHPGRRGSQRARGLKRALKAGVELRDGVAVAEAFWPVLERVLADRHGLRPVHSLPEILELSRRFPEQVRFVVAELDGEVVAGTVLFCVATAHHAQYIAAAPRGTEVGALDLLFDRCIARAAEDGARYFNFGVSTEQGGRVLNRGLHAFKAGFGGGGVVQEVFELPLARDHGA
jgi:hypothetical protein